MTDPITKYDDIIDSRDIIARIEELQNDFREATGDDPRDFAMSTEDYMMGLSEDEAEELTALIDLAAEGERSPGWRYGETLIRDSYFEDYAQQLAEDIGAISNDHQWPNYCIDWERAARELQMDYTCVEFDGVDYWIRS